jgi:hypothetical protein
MSQLVRIRTTLHNEKAGASKAARPQPCFFHMNVAARLAADKMAQLASGISDI